MNRLDRLLGILLHLRQGKTVSAASLADAFEVSPRTIYRDFEALSELGIPVYAERGREGGFHLLEGYFLPPIMFSREEAISLVVALTLLRSLRARPFESSLAAAEAKLIAAVPDALRDTLARAPSIVGFEQVPGDIFHTERSPDSPPADSAAEGHHAAAFLSALLERTSVALRYRSPYADNQDREYALAPLGLFWDRGHWYLVGNDSSAGDLRFLRADRVRAIAPRHPLPAHDSAFDIRAVLGRSWLAGAMDLWREQSPVRLRITSQQAQRLQQDWYYRHARFEDDPSGAVVMTIGEDDPHSVLSLVRWLGPGAELLEPSEWRALLRDELARLLAAHAD